MSAETLGANLLAEVKEESLDKLLQSLRILEIPSNPSLTGILPIDTLLNLFRDPPRRQPQQSFNTPYDTQRPLIQKSRPPVLELSCTSACSGRTQLLFQICALSLLPAIYNEVTLHGKTGAVILFDLSSTFSLLRLRDIMSIHVTTCFKASQASIPQTDLDDLIHTSFLHLHVFRPQSSTSLLATLANLPNYLFTSPPTHYSSSRQLQAILIHNLDAFLRQDRFDDEETSLSSSTIPTNTSKPETPLHTRWNAMTSHLRALQHQTSCLVLATSQSPSMPTIIPGTRHRSLRPHLPSPWNNFRALRIVVEKQKVAKFPPGISVDEAMGREGTMRAEAVKKAGFRAWVDWWGWEGWGNEVREVLEDMGLGGFGFVVGDGLVVGVGVGEDGEGS